MSCSKIDTGLKLAPQLINRQIDKAFDFKTSKLNLIKDQLQTDINTNKKELKNQLRLLILLLEKDFLKNDLTLSANIELYNAMAAFQSKTLHQFNPSIEIVLKDLSDKEIQYFKNFIDDKYSSEILKSKDQNEFLNQRKKSFIKFYEFLLDDLSDSQNELIHSFILKNTKYLTNRISKRQEFSNSILLKMKNKEPLVDYFLNHYKGKLISEISDLEQKQFLTDFFSFNVEFWKTINKDQFKFMSEKLSNYKVELAN